MDAIAWGDKPRHLFDEAVRKFIAEHLPNLKPSSAKRYGVSIKWLHKHFGGKTLDLIGTGALSEFETWRRAQGATAPTVRRDLACLSSIMSFCEEWEWLDDGKNPLPSYLRRRRKRGLKEAPPRTRYLSPEEEVALLAECERPLGIAVALAIDTGLRREELFSLMWPQVDMRRGIIRTTADTKNGRVRVVPLAQRSAQLLDRLPRHFSSRYVFCHPDGARFVQMQKGFKGACRRVGIADLKWHDLRRTAGCRWLQRDQRRMEEVSCLLGHSGVQVTQQRYAFLDMTRVAEETAALGA